MGYPERDAAMIGATMEEEREWQGTTATLERDAAFLRESAPQAAAFINLVSRHVSASRPRALELGSGSGWVSWLLARAGYDVYLCDFEANSLSLGLQFEHRNMGVGHRIVADARYAPFPNGAFDLVVFKEFVHHVADYGALFREADRVLKLGGVLALMEPTMSLAKKAWQIRHPDPHEGHRITWPGRYLRSLRSLGLDPIHITALYSSRVPLNPLVRALKQRAAAATADAAPLTPFTRAHLSILGGGQLVVLARKTRDEAPPERPRMTVIDPHTMTVDPASFEAYGGLRRIVEEAASSAAFNAAVGGGSKRPV